MDFSSTSSEDNYSDREEPIETLALYLQHNDHTLDDEKNKLSERCPLDNGRHSLTPIHDLGFLGRLPAEVLTPVLAQLDIESLTKFRQVNQQAMQYVDSMPQYGVVVEHASDAIRGMLMTGTASSTTMQLLYDKVCQQDCEGCGLLGGYLYLITCRRVCYHCMTENASFNPLSRAEISRRFGLQSKAIARIPQMRSVPGVYTTSSTITRRIFNLFDYDSAQAIGIETHGSAEKMKQFVDLLAYQRQADYDVRLSAYKSGGSTGEKPKRPRFKDTLDVKSLNPFRFMAIVTLPYYDKQTKSAEWGLFCKGCKREYDYPSTYHPDSIFRLQGRRQYTKETFAQHIEQYGTFFRGYHQKSPIFEDWDSGNKTPYQEMKHEHKENQFWAGSRRPAWAYHR